ncbi:karyopherin Kap95 [Suillus variegatus]|nr:karyopherin Kap95 [Suillus variegatus]
MLMLSDELCNENSQIHTRNAAGLALKNALSACDSTRQDEYSARWMALNVDARQKIKEASLLTLASPQPRAGAVAAQVVSAIAAIKLPVGQWPDLVEILLGFINMSDDTNLKIATLEVIGYICETIKPEVLALRSNEILMAVIHGACKEEPSSEVQLAVIHALFNSLEFVWDNFDREGERNYIMQVVCEATQNPLVSVQVGAFECLVKIMALYYDKMVFYMEQALFGIRPLLTVMGMKHSDERVALQAIEFWTTAAEYDEPPELESKHFAKVALPEVIPVLLNLLMQQEEDTGLGTLGADPFPCSNANKGEWNLAMSAGTCLNYMAQAVADAIVPACEAAIMMFGSILDGPDLQVLTPVVNQALPLLIGMMNDENLHVKDTTAWTLRQICDLLIITIKPNMYLHPLISALVNGLLDCLCIMTNLGRDMGRPGLYPIGIYLNEYITSASESLLSPYFEGIVSTLLWVTKTTANESNFRISAYEAITSYVSHSTTDCIPVVQNTVIAILQRMEQLLNMQLIPTVLEDAFLVVGSLAAALEAGFALYIQAFLPFLYPALKAHEDTQLCIIAVGIIGDISRALGDQSAQYAGAFMNVLLENLQSNVLDRNVKISILSCFGNIVLAIGPAFDPYLNTTSMDMLRQAGSVQPNPLDFDLMDYVAQLREGILEAYTWIVTGFKNTEKTPTLLPHVPSILELVYQCIADEERSDSIVKLSFCLIGDLADSFPNGQIKEHLLEEWITHEFHSKRGMQQEMKKMLWWAREMIKCATRLASCASAGSSSSYPL